VSEPFPLTQCKVITSSDFASMQAKTDWIMEPKIDGWRIQMDVTHDDVVAWTRTNHDASGKMPVVEMNLHHLTAGKHTFKLDGEAVYINEDGTPDYNFTARCLGSGREVCVEKQYERGSLSYCVFDILELDGHDLRERPLAYRKQLMQRFLREYEQVKLIQGVEPSYEQHIANFEQYKEGSVLKLLGAPYAGKRHKSWMKWKEIETTDVRVIGYKEGQGKFEGLIGAIEFQAPDGTKGFCSGMDDETRIWISDHRYELAHERHTIIEIKHFGKLVDGYRHPQFQRFRDDLV
jgi:ATP-dependent DNA ligase